MSNDPYFPFEPEKWWPDLFEPLSTQDREAVVQSMAANWHAGWTPNRGDAAEMIELARGIVTIEELIQRRQAKRAATK